MAVEENHPDPRQQDGAEERKAERRELEPIVKPEALKGSYGSAGASRPRKAEAPESDELLPPSPGAHYPFLDLTRISCVWCVAVDHGNSSFGHWNVLFTQDWVLQYLFLVCGVSYGMTSRRLAGYEGRLFAYFLFGALVNWSAWLLAGLDWEKNIFNVVFHLWFVIGVMIYAAVLAPLKWYLAWATQRGAGSPEADHPLEEGAAQAAPADRPQRYRDSMLITIAAIGGGLIFIVLFFFVIMKPITELMAPGLVPFFRQFGAGADFWGMPQNVGEAREFLNRICRYFVSTCSNIYLIVVCPRLLTHASITTWLVILNTYAHKLFLYRAQDERFFHGFDLMTMGLACYYLGMRHRRVVGLYLVRYWFLVLLVCSLLWPPGAHERFDENPPKEVNLRIRVNLLEAIFVVIWLAAGERLVQPEIFTEDRLQFLNSWGLLIFLVHKAVHMTLLPPLNWAALLLLAPACYVVERRKK